MSRYRIGILGAGKVAIDQHLPAIKASAKFELAATADPVVRWAETPGYESLERMLEAHPDISAVAICTPPQIRERVAIEALIRGRHVLLEKPPCSSNRAYAQIVDAANVSKRTLFQAWHSRYAASVSTAAAWLRDKKLRTIDVSWREDVRVWHPGQAWLWREGGFGVLDPGINALSILTSIISHDIRFVAANLEIPRNCETPIAATIALQAGHDVPVRMDLNFAHEGEPEWRVSFHCEEGELELLDGGTSMSVDGVLAPASQAAPEYDKLYERFGLLIDEGRSDADPRPLALALEALSRGARISVDEFTE